MYIKFRKERYIDKVYIYIYTMPPKKKVTIQETVDFTKLYDINCWNEYIKKIFKEIYIYVDNHTVSMNVLSFEQCVSVCFLLLCSSNAGIFTLKHLQWKP